MAAFTGNVNIDESVSTFVTLKECAMGTTGALRIGAISIDGSATTVGWEWKIEKKIDASNYRIIASGAVAAGLSKEVLTGHTETTVDYKVSVKSAGGGALAKTLYYEIPYGPQDDIEAMNSIFTVLGKINDGGFLKVDVISVNDNTSTADNLVTGIVLDANNLVKVDVENWWANATDPLISIDGLIDDIKAVTDALTAAKATILSDALALRGSSNIPMVNANIKAIDESNPDVSAALKQAVNVTYNTMNSNVERVAGSDTAGYELRNALIHTDPAYYINAKTIDKLSTVALSAQEKLDVNAEVDTALNTAIPASPTTGSANAALKYLIDNLKQLMKRIRQSKQGDVK